MIPDELVEAVSFAAEELQSHIQKATGASLCIVRASEHADTNGLIFVGPCQAMLQAGIEPQELPRNGFIIRLAGENLFLVGHDSGGVVDWILHTNYTCVGTLFAVYEFLDKHLGVRWVWPGELGTVVPRHSDIVVEHWNQTYQPRLVHHRWRDGSPVVTGTEGLKSVEPAEPSITE